MCCLKATALGAPCDRMDIVVMHYFGCFISTIEELALESSRVLGEKNLALLILPFICPCNIGV